MVAAVPKEVLETKMLSADPGVGRLGTAEEIARTVTFIAADDGGFITGACFDINGGHYIASLIARRIEMKGRGGKPRRSFFFCASLC